MSGLPRRLQDETGMAMVIAMSVLLITLVLAGIGAAVAIDTNAFSNRDTATKQAVEAADAGLRTAVYRLNAIKPGPSQCPTPNKDAVGSGSAPSSTLCAPDGPSPALANGANFTYWVSREIQAGDTCAGPSVSSASGAVSQRCVTAVGTVGGVSARLQERVAAYTSTPVFPTAIFGTKSVTINNNVNITTDTLASPALLGTNGTLTVGGTGGGTTTIDGWSIPAGATVQKGSNVTDLGAETNNAPQYPIPTPVNPGTSSQNTASPFDTTSTYQGGTCAVSSAQVQTNCNYRISRGFTYPGCVNLLLPVTDCDPYQGNSNKISWDPTGRTLYLGNNTSLILGGGVYNFCSLYLDNGASISLAPGARVSIFVDSPYDPNSGAPANPPAGSATNPACSSSNSSQGVAPGTFTMNNGSAINPGGTALNAQTYVYGDTSNKPPTNNANLNNNSSSSFELAAPFSNVTLNPSNNTVFKGAIVGYTVAIGNAAHFTYEADSSTLQSGSLQLYYRSAWEQCPAPPATGNPTSGC